MKELQIAYNESYVHPLPDGHRFPMLKYELIPGQLLYEGLISEANLFSPEAVSEETILLTHCTDYWRKLRDLKLTPREQRRTGFPISSSLIEREKIIAGGTIQCCSSAIETGISFNVAGGTHHAGSNWGEGFCLLNDQAIAANYLLTTGKAVNILIIDLDVHQGNGTAEIFNKNKNVFTFSMHAEKNFPFRKERSNLDIGLPNGITDDVYLYFLEKNLEEIFSRVEPDFVFYLSGVDILETDKLGYLCISREGCKTRDKIVLSYCKTLNIPVQVSMGGGYSQRIQDIVEAHCNTFRAALNLYF